MKSTLLIAALFAASAAAAQAPLLLPNNSAGSELDTPPLLPGSPTVLEPTEPRSDEPRGALTRDEVEQLAGPKEAQSADRNGDGRVDDKELRRLEDAPAPLK